METEIPLTEGQALGYIIKPYTCMPDWSSSTGSGVLDVISKGCHHIVLGVKIIADLQHMIVDPGTLIALATH